MKLLISKVKDWLAKFFSQSAPRPDEILEIEPLAPRQMLSVVGIHSIDSVAAETCPEQQDNTALFRFTRSGDTDLSKDLEVYFDASSISYRTGYPDYEWIDANGRKISPLYYSGRFVTIEAGQTSTDLTLIAHNDGELEDDEQIQLSVRNSRSYDVASKFSTASATILDNDQWSVGVEVLDPTAAESGDDEPSDTALFRFTRSGETDLSKDLEVYFDASSISYRNGYAGYDWVDGNGRKISPLYYSGRFVTI